MAKQHIKKGDTVVVLSGIEKGKRGRVLQVLKKSDRAIVEGLKMIKRHTRKNQANPNGAIIEREGTLHISKLMRAETYDARASQRAGTPEAE